MGEFVIVESPYNGPDENEIRRNIAYARLCVRWCLERGYAPFGSHLLYTQPGILDDRDDDERRWGLRAGLDVASRADASFFFADLGWSSGMKFGREDAEKCNRSWQIIRLFESDEERDRVLAEEMEKKREGWS